MDEIIITKQIDIKELMLIIRWTHELLDSDVAMLYRYETKNKTIGTVLFVLKKALVKPVVS